MRRELALTSIILVGPAAPALAQTAAAVNEDEPFEVVQAVREHGSLMVIEQGDAVFLCELDGETLPGEGGDRSTC